MKIIRFSLKFFVISLIKEQFTVRFVCQPPPLKDTPRKRRLADWRPVRPITLLDYQQALLIHNGLREDSSRNDWQACGSG